MEEKENKELDAFIKKAMGLVEAESPSPDFVSQVMNRLPEVEKSQVIQYKPLISRPVWAVIGLVFIGFMGYLFSKVSMENDWWFNKLDFDAFFNSLIPSLSFQGSQSIMYCLFFLSLMLLVQLSWMKHFFNKRLNL